MDTNEKKLFVNSTGFSAQQFATKSLYDLTMKGCNLPTLAYEKRETDDWIKSLFDSVETEICNNETSIKTTGRQYCGDETNNARRTGQEETGAEVENYEKISTSIQNALMEDEVMRNKKNYVMSSELNTLRDKNTLLERKIRIVEDEAARKYDGITKEEFREFQNKYAIVEETVNKLQDDASRNEEKYAATSRKLNVLEDESALMQKRIETLEDEWSRKNDICMTTIDRLNELRENNNLMEQRMKTLEDANRTEHMDKLFERFGYHAEKLISQQLNNNNINTILLKVDQR